MVDSALHRPAAEPRGSRRFLVFNIGEYSMALDLELVRQVIDLDSIFPIPLVSPLVEGVAYYKDSALPVLNTESLLRSMGWDETSGARPSLVLVVESDSLALGLLVNRIEGVVDDERNGSGASGPETEDILYKGKKAYKLKVENIFSLMKLEIAEQS